MRMLSKKLIFDQPSLRRREVHPPRQAFWKSWQLGSGNEEGGEIEKISEHAMLFCRGLQVLSSTRTAGADL